MRARFLLITCVLVALHSTTVAQPARAVKTGCSRVQEVIDDVRHQNRVMYFAETISIQQQQLFMFDEVPALIQTSVTTIVTDTPNTTTVAPSSTKVAPSTTTDAPSTTKVAPSTTTDAPSTTTDAPSTTTDELSTITDTLSSITVAPSRITDTPSTTTDAPSTVTDAPSTITDTLSTSSKEPLSSPMIPAGYTYSPRTGSAYKFHESAQPWHDARATCESEGAHLVVFDDADEVDVVLRIMYDTGDGDTYMTWTGVHDVRTGGQMDWRTAHGEPLNGAQQALWRASEGDPEDDARSLCALLDPDWNQLYNFGCEHYLYFTCEIEL